MVDLAIGLRGLEIAQRAIELVGTNISNAATEGYHRQDIAISPLDFDDYGNITDSTVQSSRADRQIDELVEQEFTRQQPIVGQVQQELNTLQTIEGAIGDLDSQGIGKALSDFNNSLSQLASDSHSSPLLQQTVSAADSLASQIRSLAGTITDLQSSIRLQAQATVEQGNGLIQQIADLNAQINNMTTSGANANALKDTRDQAINALGQLMDVQVNSRTQPDGMVDVTSWGTPLVMAGEYMQLETGSNVGTNFGVSVKGAGYYQSDVSGGKLGGLLNLANNLLPKITDSLNTLSGQIITQFNQIQSQGIGTGGSFTGLQGTPVSSAPLDQWSLPVQNGTIYMRVIAPDGSVTQEKIDVQAATDTVQSMAQKFDDLDHISASVGNHGINITSDAGYKFDFVPALLPAPSASTLTGTSTPAISGVYTGANNQTYTAKVVGSGDVGVAQDLSVNVYDGNGSLVKQLSVGAGYIAGTPMEIDQGVYVALNSGSLKADETFDVQAIGNSDTSGFLAAAGINTMFSGDSASNIALRSEFADNPELLAGSRYADGSDNSNVLRMVDLVNQPSTALGGVSAQEYYRRTAIDTAQSISTRKDRLTALTNVTQQLTNQRDSIGGVDINEESAKLLQFQQMFQSMAKYVSTQNQAMQTLMQMLG